MNPQQQHTPGPWQILPDPQHKGKHPLHDNRYIATAGASWEDGRHPGEWLLEGGSLICSLRDQPAQRADARLIASAPDMLQALKALYEHCAMIHIHWGDGCNSKQADEAIQAGRAAIAKAEGRDA